MTKEKTALVLGLGESGQAAATLLVDRGWRVMAVDAADGPAQARAATVCGRLGVDVRMGCTALPADPFDVCVVSPGIAIDSPWVVQACETCGEVIGELAFGARHLQSSILAVTGTNGKSTAAKLCADVLQLAGLDVELGGNYGLPLCAIATSSVSADWVVAEVSSFQLELPGDFRPRVGLYLNLQPDHMNRHTSMETYRRLKASLFDRMDNHDAAVVQAVELPAVKALTTGSPRWLAFGDRDHDFGVTDDLRITIGGRETDIDLTGTIFGNPVLARTVAGVTGACLAAGATVDVVREAVNAFIPLPHRMEPILTRDGVLYINDSKATNLAAMAAALQMLGRPVRLIAGGQLKEKDLVFLKEVLASRVRCVYVIGEAAIRMEAEWRDCVPVRQCDTLDRAVRAVQEDVQAGDVVLLSPGCASFDQFMNFEERGNTFKAIVEDL